METIETTSFAIDEIEKHPEVITRFFKDHQNVSIVLEKNVDGHTINIGIRKIYSDKVNESLQRIYKLYADKKQKGYTRDQAVKDFLEAQEQISQHITE